MVYVISKDGQPLMPTERHAKVRVLLKTGKARVDVRKLDGAKLSAGVSCKKLKLLEKRKTILIQREVRTTSSPCLKAGVSVV